VTRRVLLTVCGVLLAVAGPAAALGEPDLTPVGVDRLISDAITGEYMADVVWNATANEFLVVWNDDRNSATRGVEIYGRRVGADGVPIGVGFRISASIAEEGDPAVAWNKTANEYLVVWVDGRNDATRGHEIYGRRVSAAGVPVGSADFRISTSDDFEMAPEVAWSETSNQYLVVWDDGRSWARGSEIYGRRLAANGVPVAPDFRISNSAESEMTADVAWNATSNQFLVVWSDGRNYETRGNDIYGRRVGATGVLGTSDIRISKSPTGSYGPNEYSPSVVWNETANEYLVVWEDERRAATRGWEIYGRRVGANGIPVGAEDFRVSASTSDEYSPAVMWNATANQYLVVWQDYRNQGTRATDTYGVRVGAAGAPLGANLRISAPSAIADEYGPAVAWNATSNQYLVVWEDGRSSATRGTEIFGRRLAGDPAP
jgi:hypothetical protein